MPGVARADNMDGRWLSLWPSNESGEAVACAFDRLGLGCRADFGVRTMSVCGDSYGRVAVMKRIGQAGSSWLITAAVVVAGLAFAALCLYGLKKAFDSEPEIVVSVIAIVGGFVTTQALQRRVERERIRETRRQKLAPHYENLLTFVRDTAKGKGTKVSPRHEKFWIDLTHNMMLWGSPALIAAWARFMREIEANQGDGDTFVREYVKVLREIRVELGHNDAGKLAVRDLLKLFMTDTDDSVPEDLML